MSFPKYRTHNTLDWDHHSDKHQKTNVHQYGVQKRINNGAFGNSNHPSWRHGGRFGNHYAVYRCHTSNFRDYNVSKNNELLNMDTKKTMQSLNMDTKKTMQSLNMDTKKTMQSLNMDTKKTMQSLNMDTKKTMQALNMDTKKTMQSLNMDTKKTMQSLNMDTKKTMQSLNMDTKKTMQSLNMDTKKTMQSLNMDTKKTMQSLNMDTKKTMQSLNGRLTSYLENVKSLEEENVQLEKKICDWYEKNEGCVFPDCSHYFKMITDLQSQVLSARAQNADLSQKIVDCHMNAEDCRKSHEMEHRMRTNAEEELYKHYGIQDIIHRESQGLAAHVQNLENELLELKKTSEEEITGLQAQLGTRVNVEVETAPPIDLNATLSRIRNEYETLMERNLNDIEKMYQEMISELSQNVFSGIEQLQLSNNEVTGLKLSMLTLETELKKEWSLIRAHECTLEEIRDQYCSDLSHLQNSININESYLADIQSKLKHLNYEFSVYKDLSSSLEKDIDTYNYLLERYEALAHTQHSIKEGDGTHLWKGQK